MARKKLVKVKPHWRYTPCGDLVWVYEHTRRRPQKPKQKK